MKVWLDDEQPMPPEYDTHVKTAADAIDLLKSGEIEAISLDNDLGPPEAGEGRHVAKWIEEHAYLGDLAPVRVRIHTQNLVARDEMKAAIRNALRYWNPALGEPE